MTPFTEITAVTAPMLRANIDTDAIIPSREMKRVSKVGLADGLFAGWRYLASDSRDENPDFVLNQLPYRSAHILLGGRNFGCGSSREHAVWALAEWGIRVIVAPSFGTIFYANCIRNGILPIQLEEQIVEQLSEWVLTEPATHLIRVDLQYQEIQMVSGESWTFEIGERDRQMLLEGLDAIDVTLKRHPEIKRFEQRDAVERPWIHRAYN